jgi:hypothetical protein
MGDTLDDAAVTLLLQDLLAEVEWCDEGCECEYCVMLFSDTESPVTPDPVAPVTPVLKRRKGNVPKVKLQVHRKHAVPFRTHNKEECVCQKYHIVGLSSHNVKKYDPLPSESFHAYISRMGYNERSRLMKEAVALYQEHYRPNLVPNLELWVDHMNEFPERFEHYGEEFEAYKQTHKKSNLHYVTDPEFCEQPPHT